MREFEITKNEAGQRFDKYLLKLLKEAPSSFVHKMLRKKNIVLNGKKATGNEKLELGDQIKIFFTEDTFQKFKGGEGRLAETNDTFQNNEQNKNNEQNNLSKQNEQNQRMSVKIPEIIYEDEHLLIFNKPIDLLSQKAQKDDVSINELFIQYLRETKQITVEELQTFTPSICNRLDRNTSGLLICGKSLPALQTMNHLLTTRELHKFYQCLVMGHLEKDLLIKGFLQKDEKTNKVRIEKKPFGEASEIETSIRTVQKIGMFSLLEIGLITGKTHQIRAHLASIGHPILGDYKYGNKKTNDKLKEKYGISSQLLHSYRLVFPVMPEPFSYLSEKEFLAPLPKNFQKIMDNEK